MPLAADEGEAVRRTSSATMRWSLRQEHRANAEWASRSVSRGPAPTAMGTVTARRPHRWSRGVGSPGLSGAGRPTAGHWPANPDRKRCASIHVTVRPMARAGAAEPKLAGPMFVDGNLLGVGMKQLGTRRYCALTPPPRAFVHSVGGV